jgi:ribonuclease/clavin/mitogillin
MKQWTKPHDRYVEITMEGNVTIPPADSRARLSEIGIAGEMLPTPGHSEDSVSLVLDDGSVFVGDLTPFGLAEARAAPIVDASWRLLGKQGATRVHPGHGPVRDMPGEL